MDYDALVKGLRFALRDWKGREDRYHFPSINALTIAEAADAIADLRARNDALVKALEKAQPIVADDHDRAKEYGDSDWEGLSYEALEAIANALAANREE